MKSYVVTIQMKPRQQYFHTVLFIFKYLTEWNLGFVSNFDFKRSWEWIVSRCYKSLVVRLVNNHVTSSTNQVNNQRLITATDESQFTWLWWWLPLRLLSQDRTITLTRTIKLHWGGLTFFLRPLQDGGHLRFSLSYTNYYVFRFIKRQTFKIEHAFTVWIQQ